MIAILIMNMIQWFSIGKMLSEKKERLTHIVLDFVFVILILVNNIIFFIKL